MDVMSARRSSPGPELKADQAEGPVARAKGRRRASHSMEAVLTEAVALLDQAGEPALTFRALAARLGTGVGSIYWYVDNKDELLDRATDHVLQGVLSDTELFAETDDPIDDLRAVAVTLFDAIVRRPWLAAYFMRDTGVQPNGLLMYERIGEQVMRLGLNPRQTFYAVSAVLGFVIGIAADLGQEPPQEVIDGTTGRDEYLARAADQWRQLDPETFPFVHHIVDEFAVHDDTDQFRAGLDLLLAGLRLQAGH
jgi:AcrR family transcriptional regulator